MVDLGVGSSNQPWSKCVIIEVVFGESLKIN